MVLFKKNTDNFYDVTTLNHIKIGELLREIDGFFVFYPDDNGAAFTSHFMKVMAAKLDELNQEWSKTIDKELGDK
jgi:phage pi2 protein 07